MQKLLPNPTLGNVLAGLCLLALLFGALSVRAQTPAWQLALTGNPNQPGGGTSVARATATNAAGDVFVVGNFTGQVSFGTALLVSAGQYDAFVAKWNTASNTWAWAQRGGGVGQDYGTAVAVSGGQVFVTGSFVNSSTNTHTVTFGATTLLGTGFSSNNDVFVAKYTDNGTSATQGWLQHGGGAGDDTGRGLAVSGSSVYVTGAVFNSSINDYGVTFGAVGVSGSGPSSSPNLDAFLLKYTDNGATATAIWVQDGGGLDDDQGLALALNGSSVYITGSFSNTVANSRIVSFGGAPLHGSGASANTDAFIARYTDTGATSTFGWAVKAGGSGADQANCLVVAGSLLYLSGSYTNTAADANTVLFGGLTVAGSGTTANTDAFVAKFADTGASATATWVQHGGGSSADVAYGLAVTGMEVYMSGSYSNNAVNASAPQFGGVALGSAGPSINTDVFAAKYTDGGPSASFNWVQQAGGTINDVSYALTMSGSTLFLAAWTGSQVATFGTVPSTLVSNNTAVLAQLQGSTGNWLRAEQALHGGSSLTNAVATDAAGNVFITGSFIGQTAFGTTVLSSHIQGDMFLAKWNTAAGAWAWAVAGGGEAGDQGLGLAVSGGNVYVTGSFENNISNGNGVLFGTLTLLGTGTAFSGNGDVFLLKYQDNGNSATAVWAQHGGGTGYDYGYGIAVSGSSIFVTGMEENNSANASVVAFGGVSLNGTGSSLNYDALLVKYIDAGASASVAWAQHGGGIGADFGYGVAVNGNNIYWTGSYTNDGSNSLAVDFNGTTLISSGSQNNTDMFLLKYFDGPSPTMAWVKRGGGFGNDRANAVAVSGSSVYIAGSYSNNAANVNNVLISGVALPGSGSTANLDVLLAKYTDSGASAALTWTQHGGGTAADNATSLALNTSGPNPSVYVGGSYQTTTSGSANVQFGAVPLTGSATFLNDDLLLLKYVDGGATATLGWAQHGGGTGQDIANGVAVSGSSVYAAGQNYTTATYGALSISASQAGSLMTVLARLVDAPVPTLTAITLSSGPLGSTVVLDGTGLSGTTTITFAGAANNTVLSGFVVNTAGTQITGVVVPGGTVTGLVTATTPGGTSNGVSFTVTIDLVVTSAGATGNFPVPVSGPYNSITVLNGAVASFQGSVFVNGFVDVQSGGTLLTNCQALTGPATFSLAAGAFMSICDPAGISTASATGAVQTTGLRSLSSDASYTYNGTVAQVTGNGLPNQARSLTVNNPAGLALTQPLGVRQLLRLTPTTGNFDLNSKRLTLLSDATGTALVANEGAGLVTGSTATMQRYLDPSLNGGPGYRHYSAPVAGSTAGDLTTATFTPVVNAAFNTSATPTFVTPFPTVMGYDQARLTTTNNLSLFDKGWYSPTALSSALVVGQGYAVHLPATEKVDFTGTLNTGILAVSLARTTGPTATEAGWAMVGNPYPAPIDWSLIDPSDRPNLDGSIYVFESTSNYGGNYRSYVNGVGAPLIGSSQGFWVRVSSGQTAGSLTFRNAHRLTNFGTQVAVRRGAADARPRLTLQLQGAGLQDELTVYAEAGATAGADAEYDATKLLNPSGLNLSAVAGAQELAIQGLPLLTAATVVPLTVRVPAAGAYSLKLAALANLPASTQAFITDAFTGTRTNLRTLSATGYAFTLSAGQTIATGRFFLNLMPNAAPLSNDPARALTGLSLYPNPATISTTVQVPAVAGASATALVLRDAMGRTVLTRIATLPETGQSVTLDLRGLAAGVYVLHVQAGTAATVRRLVVE